MSFGGRCKLIIVQESLREFIRTAFTRNNRKHAKAGGKKGSPLPHLGRKYMKQLSTKTNSQGAGRAPLPAGFEDKSTIAEAQKAEKSSSLEDRRSSRL